MSLKAGDVFLYRNPQCPEKTRPHIVVAVTENRRIVYVWTSTRIKRVKFRCRNNPLTCVILSQDDCPALTKSCAIDCNFSSIAEEYVITRASSYKLLKEPGATRNLLDRIKGGILKSDNTHGPVSKILIETAYN
jgi:hypothetical protein